MGASSSDLIGDFATRAFVELSETVECMGEAELSGLLVHANCLRFDARLEFQTGQLSSVRQQIAIWIHSLRMKRWEPKDEEPAGYRKRPFAALLKCRTEPHREPDSTNRASLVYWRFRDL